MKTTWNRPWIAATVVTVLGLGLCEDNCQADSISVNFWRTDAGNVSNNTVEAGEVAGVVPVDGQFWNNIGVGAGNVAPATFSETLLDDGGSAAATIESTLSSAFVGFSGAASAPDDTGDRNMMSSYISWDVATDGTAPDDTGNITVSGLGPAYTSQGYDVYLYGDADVNNRTFTISIGGQTNTLVDDATYDGTLTLADGVGGDNENYTVFRGLTSPSFSIEMDSSVGRGAVNGMQIVSVPEPAAALILLVLMPVIASCRRS